MTLALVSMAKLSLVLLAALALTRLLRSRPAALRHAILAAAVMGGALLPLLERVGPQWPLPASLAAWLTASGTLDGGPPLQLQSEPAPPAAAPGAIAAAASASPVLTAAAAVWLAGAVLAVAALATGLLRLAWLSRHARRVDSGRWAVIAGELRREAALRRPVLLLETDAAPLLVTWGWLRPRVIYPAAARDWPEERIAIVLRHELAHIRRGDWAIQLAAEMMRAVAWCNPLLWIACRRLREESELACDDRVLNDGVDAGTYATHLVAAARETVRLRPSWSPAPAIARPSTLERRIRAMLNTDVNRAPVSRLVTAGAAAGVALVVLSVAGAVRAAPLTSAGADVMLAPGGPPAAVVSPARDAGSAAPAAAPEPAAPAAAQAGGSITGVLSDPLGGLLPGAAITVVEAATGRTHTATSDRSGSYLFVNVAPGAYALTARLPGFATINTGFTVASGATLQHNLTLPLGSLQETITIVGGDGDNERRVLGVPNRTPAPAPAAAAPLPAAGTYVGGNIKVPRKLRHVNPVYPQAAQAARLQGIVTMEATIGADGRVQDTRITTSVPGLDEPSAEAVREWEFTPTLLNGHPVPVRMNVSLSYSVR